MPLIPPFENWYLRAAGLRRVAGALRLPPEVFAALLAAPHDPSPDFVVPTRWRRREADHPRYARFCYALARATRARRVLEVGSSSGGTSSGWARALGEAAREGEDVELVCVDNDSYAAGVYPAITAHNVARAGLPSERVTYLCGDSAVALPGLRERYGGHFDICLVDGDHTFEGATTDLENALPLVRPGGLIAVHDVDPGRAMAEATPAHPAPVYDALTAFASRHALPFCILRFIRKHLAIVRVG